MMQDVGCVFATTRARASEWGIDPDRIAVMGYSAGAHLVSLLAVASDEADFAPTCAGISAGDVRPPAAVISGAGPQDLREWGRVRAVVDLLGEQLDNEQRYTIASPITHVSASSPPFLFLHGRDDLVVPIEQSRDMKEALEASGVEARLLEVAGGGHVIGIGTGSRQELGVLAIDTPEAWLALMDFLADTVGAP
jgi:acetyl esterase/lipase